MDNELSAEMVEQIKFRKKQHKEQHIKLHKCLDELLADFINHTSKLPSKTTIMELATWAFGQTKKTTEVED